jgi:hypothetical protein
MKRKIAIVAAVALAAYAVPAAAQHVHEQAQAAPQAGPPAGAPARGPQTPPIDVPWDDSIPAGTAEHAANDPEVVGG